MARREDNIGAAFQWTARRSISPAECQQNAALARRGFAHQREPAGMVQCAEAPRRRAEPLGTGLAEPYMRADERVLDHALAPV